MSKQLPQLEAVTTPALEAIAEATATVDRPILTEMAKNDPVAVQEFLDRYSDMVKFLARRSLGFRFRLDSADVDDAVQDACIAVWRAASRFDPRLGSEKAFVAMVVRRRLIDCQRRRNSRISTQHLEVDPQEQGESRETILDQALDLRTSALLSRIDPQHRALLEMRVVHGQSNRQIARATGMKPNTVKTTIDRTLTKLRAELDPDAAAA